MPSDLNESRVREIMECFGRAIDMRPVSRKEIAELCRGFLAAADAETIKREAVREFAGTILAHEVSSQYPIKPFVPSSLIRELAAARGVSLDEKP